MARQEDEAPGEATDGLDDAQRGVVQAPITARMIVLAPPGTGKTFTLIRRARSLVSSGQAGSASSVVVLSFTRAAVAEVVSRVNAAVAGGQAGDDLRYITVRTFDSFATQLLLLDKTHDEIGGGGHEERIRRFTRWLEEGALPKAAAKLGEIRSLMVDEVQDLVGARARMVLELARRVLAGGGGVMLFGDFAQAIYDYQEKDKGADGIRSGEFLARARRLLGPGRVEIPLGKDHRSTNDAMRAFVREARQAMGEDGTEPDGVLVARLLTGLGPPSMVQSLVAAAPGRKVAVLTRNNIQAYHVTEWCRKSGIPAEALRGSTAGHVPGWVARLTLGYRSSAGKMSLSMAASRWARDVGEGRGPAFDAAVQLLREAGAVDGQAIDLRALNRAVLERRPALINRPVGAGVIAVSTIHRSKGLEFDDVYVMEPEKWQGNPDEVRVVYVAATRARDALRVLCRDNKTLGIRPPPFGSPVQDHFHRYHREGDLNELFLEGLAEIDEDSLIDDLTEAGDGTPALAVIDRQSRIWAAGGDGGCRAVTTWSADGCELGLVRRDGSAEFTIPVCLMSQSVENDLRRLSRKYRISQPRLAVPGFTEVATVAYPPDDDHAAMALGDARLAVAPVLSGWAAVISTE